MLRAQKRILQKRKLLGTLNINISASLREEKRRWLHFHSWCEHSWGASVSPVSFRAPRATRGNVDVFVQKWRSADYSGSEGGRVPERISVCQRCDVARVLLHISPTLYMPQFIHQNADYSSWTMFVIYATEELGEESFTPHVWAFWIWMKWWIVYYYSKYKGRITPSSVCSFQLFRWYH